MYYIYHIPGKKIGVSRVLDKRLKNQGYKISDAKILEEHTDIYEVSKRELELQKEYGYTVDDKPYHILCKLASKGGFKQGPENVKSGQLKSISKKGGIAGNRARGLKYGKIAAESGQLAEARKKAYKSISKPVLKYDLNKNLLKEYKSLSDCSKDCNISRYFIRKVLTGEIKQYNNLIFKFK